METNETEPICEGCKNRDRMIRELAERVDELERERAAEIRATINQDVWFARERASRLKGELWFTQDKKF